MIINELSLETQVVSDGCYGLLPSAHQSLLVMTIKEVGWGADISETNASVSFFCQHQTLYLATLPRHPLMPNEILYIYESQIPMQMLNMLRAKDELRCEYNAHE